MRELFSAGMLIAALMGPVHAQGVQPWWEAFGHPGLTAAIEQGLSSHPTMGSALARLGGAEAGVALARSGRRPELGVRAGYRSGREQTMETGGVEDDIDPLFASARLSWELDIFRKTGAAIDAASARVGQSEADFAGVRLLLSLEIARSYVALAHLNEQARWNREEAEDAWAIYERARRRTEAGLEPDTARARALATLEQAEHTLARTVTERDKERARLTSLVGGTPLGEEPTSLAGFTLPPQPDLDLEGRLVGRPDVVQAHYAWLEAQGEAVAAARTRLPSLSLVVSAAGDGSDAGDPESWAAWAGPVVSLPVWNPGYQAQSRWARAREEAAEETLRAVSLRAVEEIDRAWVERSRSEEMVGQMQARYQALSSIAEAEARKRAAGLIQEDALRRSRRNAARAAREELEWRAAALRAHLDLIASLGGDS